MGPSLCKKSESTNHSHNYERSTTIKETLKKLFPKGKHFYNKDSK